MSETGAIPASGRGDGASESSSVDHLVHFYEDDEFLTSFVANFLNDGVRAGDALIVIATEHHSLALQARLEALGVDVADLCTSGQLILLDASDTLATFMRNGQPDRELFERSVGAVVGQKLAGLSGRARLRAYGEMVDVLWTDGQRDAAIRLEELWTDLQQRHAFPLLCAYAVGNFYKEPADLRRVCAAHTHAVGAGFVTSLPEPYVHRLAKEIAQREHVESSLRASLRELRDKEAALRESEEQLRDFVENATIGLHRVGPDGRILWANRAELELLGYSEDEYVGRSIIDFHVDRAVIDDILDRLTRGESLHNYEARLRAKDGSIKHVLISSNVYRREGNFVYSRCFTHDITERRQAEHGLIERERQLQIVTDALPTLVAFVDNQQRYKFVSAAYERWFGHSKAEIIDKHLREVLGRDAYEAIRPHVESALSGETVSYEAEIPYRNGGTRFIGATYIPQRADDGSIAGFVALVADISDRKNFEQFRAEAAGRAAQLYRFAQAVVSADEVDQVFEAALTSIEAAVGTKRAAILTFDSDGVMRFKAWHNLSDAYRSAVEGHSPWAVGTSPAEPILVPDASSDPAMAAFLPLFEREGIGALAFIPLVTRGRLIGKCMLYFDEPHVFASHEVETAEAIANHLASVATRFDVVAKLEDTIRYNEIFAGALAHDLRNPLNAIMTAGQLLLMRGEASPPDFDVKPLGSILSSGRRISTMIDQLLDFTRARSGGGIDIRPTNTNLADLCAQAVGELELAHPRWKIHRNIVGDQDGTWDADRLLQVISNLVANAGQHGTPDTLITVELDGTHPDHVTFQVHNQGAVPESLLPQLFDPFRSTRHRRDQSRGLGLGLFIVREVVRAHGGTVDVASSEADGTTFTVTLPRVGAAERVSAAR